MTRFLTAFIFLTVLVGCSATRLIPDYSKIISDDHLSDDSLVIKITYTHIPTCTEQYNGQLLIGYMFGKSRIYNLPYDGEKEELGPIARSVIDEVRKFEAEGKTEKFTCGGISGGNGILVKMYVNEDSTQFGFCRDNWDGIEELMTRLRKRN